MKLSTRFRHWLARTLAGDLFASISAVVDDSPGYNRLNSILSAEQTKLYGDALEAWRKNPYAKRIISIISDYILGDELLITSKNPHLKRFIQAFWNHPENHMDLRLEEMSDELARAGDLFPVLFLQEETGLSILRFVPKDHISEIRTADNDWETELVYIEPRIEGDKTWIGVKGATDDDKTIMLHYTVNKPLGSLTGEGDLNAALPWLQRYSRMLEDRIKLHWSSRIFLWFVTVPSSKVKEKQAQYAIPPESGSIIVKDDGEVWDMQTPNLQGRDAAADLAAVRQMIRANDGFPPHWSGEAGASTEAEARAMQAAPERHLKRRQRYFVWLLQDILYKAYQRGVVSGKWLPLPSNDYKQLFTVKQSDISREDNQNLALASKDLSAALMSIAEYLPNKSKTFTAQILDLVYKFAGESLPVTEKEKIIHEAWTDTSNPTNPKPVVSIPAPTRPVRNGQHR